ncbi:MAG: hypothetical protein CVU97_05825 [Firmicutes bacterium HGW-Firmicutes-21]|nr:MAG: hypothetical protein CVU97_05825 [Firmicutes bacterium HGW-Firmicutes-21]
MKIMKKTILIVVAVLLFVSVFAGCKTTKPSEESNVSETSGSNLIVKDMNKRAFKVFCWDFGYGSKSILGYTGEVISNSVEEKPALLDEAKARVIAKVEEEYNCTVSGTVYGGIRADFTNTIKNMVLTGTNEYDMIFDAYSYLAPLVTENILLDLNTISTIDFENEWWDQNARKELSIFNKLFFMCGDINTYDNDGTWCMLFNKTLLENLSLNIDPYQLVKDDEWYFDKFVEICRSGITTDSDGNGVLDEFDTWAFGTETYNMYVHVLSSGNKIVTKDIHDVPEFTVQNESTYSALDKIVDFYTDYSTVMVANAPPYTGKGYPNVWEATVHKAFIEGRQLFYMCGLINVPSFRQMDDDFGILPIPKLNKGQEFYYHTVSTGNMTALCVPQSVIAADDVGIIIEALGKYSMDILSPAYYDVQLKYRDTRDEESSEMLDIIFATRTFDIGAAFNWGGTLGEYTKMDKNFVSRFDSIMSAAEAALDETLSKIAD